MEFVTALNSASRTVEFDRKKGCYMIVRGEMPTGSLTIAEFADDAGHGFALQEIDEAEIALSFDYTVAWITARTSTSGQARSVASSARKALLKAGIGFTSAADFAHEHLFVPSEKATETMALLDEIELEFRMLESEESAIHWLAS